MSHIFISYSRTDNPYMHQLKAALEAQGFQVWVDEGIEYGVPWLHAIAKAINECAAVIVLMSPEAAGSEWVAVEIAAARREQKLIYPILLNGNVFPSLEHLECVTTTAGALPPQKFFNTLSQYVPQQNRTIVDPNEQKFSLRITEPAGFSLEYENRYGLFKNPDGTDDPEVKRYRIAGEVIPHVAGLIVSISIETNKVWPQCDCRVQGNGTFSGHVFLHESHPPALFRFELLNQNRQSLDCYEASLTE